MANVIRTYYQLTKPGIIYGNALPAIAGFFLASQGHINVWLLVSMLLGTSLIIASACVFNNYIDRNIDKKMHRTKNRALVIGSISAQNAIVYASILGIVGVLILTLFTNLLTVGVGLIGFFNYVVLYGITKRRSIHGTIIGSISGATPPVAGYVAVTNHFDLGALLLFLVLIFWQMPHFYAIAIYRLKDYATAGIPVLPVRKSIVITKVHMLFYLLAFVITALLLTLFKFTGYTYLVIIALLGFTWLGFGVHGFWTKDTERWARQMFFFSLIIILIFSVTLSFNIVLP